MKDEMDQIARAVITQQGGKDSMLLRVHRYPQKQKGIWAGLPELGRFVQMTKESILGSKIL